MGFRPWALPLAPLALALLLGGCHGTGTAADAAAPLPVVAVTQASRADLVNTLELASEFKPFQEIGVFAKEAGYVEHIYVDVGSRVKAGDLLAVLEIPELQDQLAQAQATAVAAGQEIDRARQELERDQANFSVAHAQATRLEQVAKAQPGLVAQQEVDNASGADEAAAAQVAAAKSALEAAQSRLTAAEAAQKQAATLLGYSRIEAPFTGVVTARYADNGALLQAGVASHVQAMPLVQLSQNDLLRLVIPVPEDTVAKIALNQPVQVRVPALGRDFPGRVARFADQLDLETRTMHTEVDVPNPDYILMPGMYAYAELAVERAPNALSLPVSAVTASGDQASVLVVNAQHQIERRAVTLGLRTPQRIEIKTGVADGEWVVAAGAGGLRAGEAVQPQPVAAAGGGPK